MTSETVYSNEICALTSFSVGTLEGRDAMMALEYATSHQGYMKGLRERLLLALNPDQARELAQGLLLAANAADMGQPPSKIRN
jgi:hypothetical protein